LSLLAARHLIVAICGFIIKIIVYTGYEVIRWDDIQLFWPKALHPVTFTGTN
jgi:hypothetical protein